MKTFKEEQIEKHGIHWHALRYTACKYANASAHILALWGVEDRVTIEPIARVDARIVWGLIINGETITKSFSKDTLKPIGKEIAQ